MYTHMSIYILHPPLLLQNDPGNIKHWCQRWKLIPAILSEALQRHG